MNRRVNADMLSQALFDLNDDPLPLRHALTITGSREICETDWNPVFGSALRAFVGKGHTWLLGGAIGIDQIATEWLLAEGETVVAVVPFQIADQPKRVQETLSRVSRCVELRLKKSKKAYLDRNAFMVDRSDVVIAFWNGQKGGTWATMQHALKSHKQVHVYPVDGA